MGYTFQEAFNNITSGYGLRDPLNTSYGATSSFHGAIDIGAPEGTRVNAVGEGKVVTQENDHPQYGIFIEIQHPSGKTTLYAHLNESFVVAGENGEIDNPLPVFFGNIQ